MHCPPCNIMCYRTRIVVACLQYSSKLGQKIRSEHHPWDSSSIMTRVETPDRCSFLIFCYIPWAPAGPGIFTPTAALLDVVHISMEPCAYLSYQGRADVEPNKSCLLFMKLIRV